MFFCLKEKACNGLHRMCQTFHLLCFFCQVELSLPHSCMSSTASACVQLLTFLLFWTQSEEWFEVKATIEIEKFVSIACMKNSWGGRGGNLFPVFWHLSTSKWGRSKNLPIHLNKMTINWQVSIFITLSTPASSDRSQIVGTEIPTFLGLVPLRFHY